MLLTIFTILVFATIIGSTYLFKHNGKRSVFKIDLVQFVYLFVVAPLLFVWGKTFLFYLVRNELTLSVSVGEMFVIDTFFSILAFYIFAAVSIHSLTKTFWLRRRDDPEFDLYHLSEYFHLWWTHIALYLGAMMLLLFISMTNIFIPIPMTTSGFVFLGVPALGLFLGLLLFVTIWLSNPKQKHANFLRLMKLLVAIFLTVHIAIYAFFQPTFNITYGLYWFVFNVFLAANICGFFFERTKKTDDVLNIFKHIGWGDNIDLFDSQDE